MVCIGGKAINQGGCGPITTVNKGWKIKEDGTREEIEIKTNDIVIFKDTYGPLGKPNHQFDYTPGNELQSDTVYEVRGRGGSGDFEGLIQGCSFETGEWETLGKLSHFEVGTDTIRALDTEGYRYGIRYYEYGGKRYGFVTKKKYGDAGDAKIIGDFYKKRNYWNIEVKDSAGNFC